MMSRNRRSSNDEEAYQLGSEGVSEELTVSYVSWHWRVAAIAFVGFTGFVCFIHASTVDGWGKYAQTRATDDQELTSVMVSSNTMQNVHNNSLAPNADKNAIKTGAIAMNDEAFPDEFNGDGGANGGGGGGNGGGGGGGSTGGGGNGGNGGNGGGLGGGARNIRNGFGGGFTPHVTSREEGGAHCFPGEALAEVRGRGLVAMDSLNVGDEVLVLNGEKLVFEPLLGFLHKTTCDITVGCQFVVIVHKHGELRISDHHLVLSQQHSTSMVAAAKLRRADNVFVATAADDVIKASKISAIMRGVTQRGMFAPITAAGTVVVDGVVASVYAGAPRLRNVPHGSAHAIFFFLRAYHKFGFARRMETLGPVPHLSGSTSSRAFGIDVVDALSVDDWHPFVKFLLDDLHLQKPFIFA